MRALRLVPVVAAGVLLVGLGVRGLGGDPTPPATMGTVAVTGTPRLVLVSGRDDHGMVATDQVPMYDEPEGDKVGTVHDGTLAEVLSVDGQWLQVRAVEGGSQIGWVDDFFLRGEVRLVGPAPSCRTSVGGESREGGTLAVVRELRQGRVYVETITPPVVRGWASRDDVQELPPQGPQCGDIPLDDKHAHSH